MTPIDAKFKIIEFESLGTMIRNTKRFMAIGLCRKNEQGCPYEAPYDNRNCEVEKGWPAAFKQNLGAYYGDNCAVVKGKFKYKQSNSRWAYNWQASISVYSECSSDSSK